MGIKILDTTLRDGSYAVNFSFTTADTTCICRALEEAGVDLIEIGHGVGLGGSDRGYGKAVATDEEYMIAASKVLKRAKYGMFCIPGIAAIDDIDMAAHYGMGFIRIGTDVTQIGSSEPFIKKAKQLGLFVSANYMKSYAITPSDFAEKVKMSEAFGADMVYIVDSAGGMFREDVMNYVQAIKEVSDISIGFHGHDNLGMGVANSIEAVRLGVKYIDTTLQGLGRSSGNSATELVVLALKKKGYELPVDYLKILEAGRIYVQPLITTQGRSVLDMVAGYADFHSSYMKYIHKYAAKYNANPVQLIVEFCKVDKVNLDETILDSMAKQLSNEENVYLGNYEFNRYVGDEQSDSKKRN